VHDLIHDEPELAEAQLAVAAGLARVVARIEAQLASDLPPVQALCKHVERYRGKMLRPTLTLAWGLAAGESRQVSEEHVICGAVCEMVHLATLVHDDVLDEASTRRGGETINGLHGNEAAVMLGDYLIAAAYHLCSQLDSQKAALAVASASMSTASGELLQLHNRGNWSIDEPTYFEIVDRKTAALIALSCELGVRASGGSDEQARAAASYGRRLGIAFQIKDDLLDLTGDERLVGKPLGKDAALGKLTLPLIHHLDRAGDETRRTTLRLIESLGEQREGAEATRALRAALAETGSVDHARKTADELVEQARDDLSSFAESDWRLLLDRLAQAVLTRDR